MFVAAPATQGGGGFKMRASLLVGLSVCAAFSFPALSQVPATAGALHTQIEGIDIPHVANAPFGRKCSYSGMNH